MNNLTQYLIALEGGGTRSQAALMDSSGEVLHTQESRDVNTNFTSLEAAQSAVREAVRGVLNAAQVPGDQVGLFASALVGPRLGAETFADFCPNAHYVYYGEGDVVFARAGVYRPNGIALVAATGATAFGVRRSDGKKITMGGWGSLLGDEGSAYALGLNGIRAAVRVFEGREDLETGLVEALCEYLSIPPQKFHAELIRLAYLKPLSRAEIAGFAAYVTRLAGRGDRLATRITGKTAYDLAQLALHTARRLFMPGEAFTVAVAGGLTNAGDLILAPLRDGLTQEFPRARLITGSLPPAAALGSLALFNIHSQEASC